MSDEIDRTNPEYWKRKGASFGKQGMLSFEDMNFLINGEDTTGGLVGYDLDNVCIGEDHLLGADDSNIITTSNSIDQAIQNMKEMNEKIQEFTKEISESNENDSMSMKEMVTIIDYKCNGCNFTTTEYHIDFALYRSVWAAPDLGQELVCKSVTGVCEKCLIDDFSLLFSGSQEGIYIEKGIRAWEYKLISHRIVYAGGCYHSKIPTTEMSQIEDHKLYCNGGEYKNWIGRLCIDPRNERLTHNQETIVCSKCFVESIKEFEEDGIEYEIEHKCKCTAHFWDLNWDQEMEEEESRREKKMLDEFNEDLDDKTHRGLWEIQDTKDYTDLYYRHIGVKKRQRFCDKRQRTITTYSWE